MQFIKVLSLKIYAMVFENMHSDFSVFLRYKKNPFFRMKKGFLSAIKSYFLTI
jgi:hypothetical protein